jgi:hypothetical protein
MIYITNVYKCTKKEKKDALSPRDAICNLALLNSNQVNNPINIEASKMMVMMIPREDLAKIWQ